MTEPDNSCKCGRPTRNNAYACDVCADEAFKALGDVPWLDEELETSTTKVAGIDYRRVGGGKGGKKDAERPSPVSWGASDARAHLRAIMVAWVLYCAQEDVRNSSPYPGLPNDTLPAMSRWLMWRVDGLTLLDIGPDAIDEITDAVARCHRIIDRPADREFYGPCECGRDLYAKPKSPAVKCRDCGKLYDAAEMAEWMHGQVVGRLVTLREGGVLLGRMGFPVPHDTLKTWARREKFLPHATDREERNLYSFDDLWQYAASRAS